MYISNVHIENFRNFKKIDIPLKPFTIIVGKNDTGKSNLVDALNILLYNNKSNYYAKSLSIYDFNIQCRNDFISKMRETYEDIKDNFNKETYERRLLFIIDDDDTLKRNFQKRRINIVEAMKDLGIEKAILKDWFPISD